MYNPHFDQHSFPFNLLIPLNKRRSALPVHFPSIHILNNELTLNQINFIPELSNIMGIFVTHIISEHTLDISDFINFT